MKKLKTILAMVMTFVMALSVVPVYASESEPVLEETEAVTKESDEEETVEEVPNVSGTPSDIILQEKSSRNGKKQINIQARADSETDSEFRIYFYEYDGNLPSNSNAWEAYFTIPCKNAMINGMTDGKIILPMKDGTGTEAYYCVSYNSAGIESVYLEFSMPQTASMNADITIGCQSQNPNLMLKAQADGETKDYLPLTFEAVQTETESEESGAPENNQAQETETADVLEDLYTDDDEFVYEEEPDETLMYKDDDEFELSEDETDDEFMLEETEDYGIMMLADEPEAFAVYSDDDTSLTFAYGEVPAEGGSYNGKTVTNLYTGFEQTEYSASNKIPWYSARLNATSVVIDDSFADADITSMQWWFNNFHYASFSGLENINTSNVTSMKSAFYDCDEFDSFESLSTWDTSQVTSMESMFYSCDLLYNADAFSGWDTGNVTTFYDTFCKCSNLTNVDGLANWDVSSATKLYYMFSNCSSLENVDGLASWNTASASDLADMFYECDSLENADGLTDWDMSSATSLQYMFYGCTALKEINVSKWDTSNVTKMGRMFNGCSDLVTIYSDDDVFVTDAVTSGAAMFTGCTNLIGGNGTAYDSDNVTYAMAHVDITENPGYFTEVEGKCHHTYVGEVVKEPTCAQAGEMLYTCSQCGATYTEEIEALGHDYSSKVTTEATCTKDGVRTYTCSRCGDEYTEAIKATGHTAVTDKAVSATCTKTGLTEGSHCSVCGEVLVKQETVKAKGHTEVKDKAVSATCTKTGLTEGSHCSVCGTVIKKQETTEKLGHNYKWVTDKEADYGIAGSRHQECTRCGAKGKTEEITAKSAGRLYPKATSVTKTSQKISWNSIKGATKYVVYGSKCGGSYEKLKTVKNGTSYTHKKLKSGTYYKYYVVAYNGSTQIQKSYVIHSTTKGSSYWNPAKPTVKKSNISVKAGNTKQIKATWRASKSVKNHWDTKLKYYSSDTSIAKVSSSGVVTGKKSGTCKIYVVAQNGKKCSVSVTVK